MNTLELLCDEIKIQLKEGKIHLTIVDHKEVDSFITNLPAPQSLHSDRPLFNKKHVPQLSLIPVLPESSHAISETEDSVSALLASSIDPVKRRVGVKRRSDSEWEVHRTKRNRQEPRLPYGREKNQNSSTG